jgi:hypothetical protein
MDVPTAGSRDFDSAGLWPCHPLCERFTSGVGAYRLCQGDCNEASHEIAAVKSQLVMKATYHAW